MSKLTRVEGLVLVMNLSTSKDPQVICVQWLQHRAYVEYGDLHEVEGYFCSVEEENGTSPTVALLVFFIFALGGFENAFFV